MPFVCLVIQCDKERCIRSGVSKLLSVHMGYSSLNDPKISIDGKDDGVMGIQ